MGKSLKKLNRKIYNSQNGICYYCNQPMWIESPDNFREKYKQSQRRVIAFQSTAEHQVPRSSGGTDKEGNIVSACRFCNMTRHRAKRPLPPQRFQTKARRRLRAGKWHGFNATG